MAEQIEHDIILRLEEVSKVYSGIVAVKRANLELRRGAVNVLVGENGAGKSTLMKIIAGVERPTLGRIVLDGETVSFDSPADAQAHGIGMIFQELNLFSNMSVAENIFATREIKRGILGIDHKAQVEKANAFLDRLDAGISAETMVEDLPIGQQQLVEIAKAMSLNARILIMDEPTSALSAAEVEILFKVIAELKAQGVAIVYISHRLEELMRIGDYITVLRDGQITGHAMVRDIDTKWIVRSMIGSDAKDFAKAATTNSGGGIPCRGDQPAATDRRSRRRSRLAFGPRRRDPRHLRPDGRRTQRVLRMRHRPPRHSTGKIFIDGQEVRRATPPAGSRRGLP
jgi:erythritol transport system ATP-binding protein